MLWVFRLRGCSAGSTWCLGVSGAEATPYHCQMMAVCAAYGLQPITSDMMWPAAAAVARQDVEHEVVEEEGPRRGRKKTVVSSEYCYEPEMEGGPQGSRVGGLCG
jgi:hypothetical protein